MSYLGRVGISAVALVGFAPAVFAADIIVVSHGQASDPFWSVVKNGVEQAAQHTGANVEYRAPETFDMVAMGQLIDAAVNQEPDGLIISMPDADALGPSVEKAVAAGIPVISMNSGGEAAKGLGALLHVGQSEFDAGKACRCEDGGIGAAARRFASIMRLAMCRLTSAVPVLRKGLAARLWCCRRPMIRLRLRPR